MKTSLITCALVALLTLAGCKSGTSGGPGSGNTGGKPMVGEADETFRLSATEAVIRQGETKSLSITITRSLNFDEDVEISFGELPQGLSVDDTTPMIDRGATEARFTLTAAEDAALGDFSLAVTGKPTNGGDATNTFKITVTKS